jgi:hypothetical protein
MNVCIMLYCAICGHLFWRWFMRSQWQRREITVPDHLAASLYMIRLPTGVPMKQALEALNGLKVPESPLMTDLIRSERDRLQLRQRRIKMELHPEVIPHESSRRSVVNDYDPHRRGSH